MSEEQNESSSEQQLVVSVDNTVYPLTEDLTLDVRGLFGNDVLLRDSQKVVIPIDFLTGFTDIPLIPGDAYSLKSYHGFSSDGDLYMSDDEAEKPAAVQGSDEFEIIPEEEKKEADALKPKVNWARTRTTGYNPPPLIDHTTTEVDGALFVFGGRRGEDDLLTNTVFRLDLESLTWDRLESCGDVPPPVAEHAAVAIGSSIYVFGGIDENGATAKVSVLNTKDMSWADVETTGNWPSPRFGHTATLSTDGKTIVFIGGKDASKDVVNDVYFLDTDKNNWTKAHCDEEGDVQPEPFFNHVAIPYNGSVYVTGGVRPMMLGTMFEYISDVWRLDLDTKKWIGPLNVANEPGFKGRSKATANAFDQIAVITGGQQRFFDDESVAFLDLENLRWLSLPVGGIHRDGRHGHTANIVGNKIWLFGGHETTDDLYAVTSLDFSDMFDETNKDASLASVISATNPVEEQEGEEEQGEEDEVVEIEE
eukprot:TRINITY_DN2531_c0_g1_i1.p1 TRINITY_DN2531_c0_g1~~TRINITY_DN2531_c0_g1_i1.p1  ORF type:complete len:478 (+),score=194.78 TRINITY_DN2531_c0_g1_i1:556-1989(+)